jgi:peptide/nickel transport system permease protein
MRRWTRASRTERVVRRDAAVLAAALVPGLCHVLLGRRTRGLHLAACAGSMAALAWWRWPAVATAFASPHAGDRLAAWFIGAVLAGTLAASIADAGRLLARSPGGAARPARRSPLRLAARRFSMNRLALAAVYAIAVLYSAAILAPVLAPYDPAAIENVLDTRYQPPSWSHPFGTDEFGRDLFSRALFGARVSLSIGLLAMLIAVSVGTAYGAVAGYAGGLLDNVLMRVVDVIIAFPTFFLMLALVGIFDADIVLLVLILGLTSWTGTARLVRGEILSLKARDFAEGGRAIGLPPHLIVARHLVPNALSSVLVTAALMVGGLIAAEAGLSFLGIGIRPPTASWGNMVSAGNDALLLAWWIAFFPGALLALTILSFNLLADGLRDALDPKTLMRRYL